MRFHLPSGAVAELDEAAEPLAVDGCFADELARLRLRLADEGGAPVNVAVLPLGDLHALRAIARRLDLLPDETMDVTCRNCDRRFPASPCSTLELGPYLDGELDDPKLDAPFDFEALHDVRAPDLATLRLAPRTVGEAAALHRALARPEFVLDSRTATSMGVVQLDDECDPRRIARRLQSMSDEAFAAVVNVFETAHYPARLVTPHPCPECGAVEWIEAPSRRELTGAHGLPAPGPARAGTDEPFPDLDAFEALVREVAPRVYAEAGVANVGLVVHEGPAHLDDGGTPLLGSYVPGDPDAFPPRASEVTLYYRTFSAMWSDDGPYDLRAEIEETLAHELTHHLGHLAGDDPLDDEEQDDLGAEYVGRVGRGEARRRMARSAGAEIGDFVRGTWWLWIVVAVATAFAVSRAP